jgi:hypothetical protein
LKCFGLVACFVFIDQQQFVLTFYASIFNVSDYCRGDDQNSGPDATSLRIIQLLGNQEKNPIIYYVDNYIFSVSENVFVSFSFNRCVIR